MNWATKLNFEKINGYEIIDFLNKVTTDNEELCDIGTSEGSFVFNHQSFKNNLYMLRFTANFNNWGTEQPQDSNILMIDKDGIRWALDEPFEGDGTDEALTEVLSNWLETHEFTDDSVDRFLEKTVAARRELEQITFTDKNQLQKVIKKLKEAYTYMK